MSAGGDDYKTVFQLLLDRGAKIDATDHHGATLLMHAARGILPSQQIQLLLDKGANPNLRDRQGDTALIHVAWWTQYDLIVGGKLAIHWGIGIVLLLIGGYQVVTGERVRRPEW